MKMLLPTGTLPVAALLIGCAETNTSSVAEPDEVTKKIVVQDCVVSTSWGRGDCVVEAMRICKENGFGEVANFSIPKENTDATSKDVTATCAKRIG